MAYASMMAVMNNWDLKDENNAVYSDKSSDRDILLTSDIGATFGTNGLSWTKDRSKGDVNSFQKSKFITHQTDSDDRLRNSGGANAATGCERDAISEAARPGMDWQGNPYRRCAMDWFAIETT